MTDHNKRQTLLIVMETELYHLSSCGKASEQTLKSTFCMYVLMQHTHTHIPVVCVFGLGNVLSLHQQQWQVYACCVSHCCD